MIRTRTSFPCTVRIVESLPIQMPDGTILSARAWLPETTTPVPAILEYLPYRKRDGTRARDQGIHLYLAGHGYAAIRLDIRGMGDSEGVLHDEYTATEQQDGCDAIAWIAVRTGATVNSPCSASRGAASTGCKSPPARRPP